MVLYWAKVVVLLALAVFLSFGSYLWWTLAASDKQLTTEASSVIANLDYNIRNTFDNINRDCGTGKPCGLVANTNKTIIKAGDAVVQTQIEEKKVTDQVAPHAVAAMDKLGNSATDLGNTAKSLGKTSDELTNTLKIANNKDTGLPALFANANGAVADVREQLKSQAVQNAVADLARTIHFTADTTQNFAGISKDLKLETDKLVTPKSKSQTVMQWLPAGAKVGMTVTCALLGPC